MSNKLNFIDLFAGIGGFHAALSKLNCECVFASELSQELRDLYKKNYNIECAGDITKIDIKKEIPQHDILCAGFPCQSFSKAGNQKGMKEARGKLFSKIIEILTHHKPKFFILENVRNILSHNNGNTWQHITKELKKLNYYFDKEILSPHFINIPQHRERVFIIGSLQKKDIENFKWLKKEKYNASIENILIKNLPSNQIEKLKVDKKNILDIWIEMINNLPKDVEPYSPLWSMEFEANYPIDVSWEDLSIKEWQKYKGKYGYSLVKCKDKKEILQHLPNYVIKQKGIPPLWKQNYIFKNREFYKKNKKFISKDIFNFLKNLKKESWQKLEWNAKGTEKKVSNKLIQFRGSGIRIKKNDFTPSLVTVSTQVPIIGKEMRYLTPRECAKIQSLPDNISIPKNNNSAFRVFGNMVNVDLVYKTAACLLKNIK